MGGWAEEVFYSLYQAGSLRCHQGDWVAGMQRLLEAWEQRPSRTEPLYELAWRLRTTGDHRSAYLFARRGLDRPMPDDSLFVQPWVYRWGLLFECSISAFWIGEIAEADEACRRLLALSYLPPTHREQTEINLEMVRGRLGIAEPAARSAGAPRAMTSRIGAVGLDVDPPWPVARASVGGDAGAAGLRMLARTTKATEDRPRSADYLVELDESLAVASVQPLSFADDAALTGGYAGSTADGVVESISDYRIVCAGGAWVASATLHLAGGGVQPGLLTLAGGLVTAAVALRAPDRVGPGDIWLPFVAGTSLHFLHLGEKMAWLRHHTDRGVVEAIGQPVDLPWSAPVLDATPGVAMGDGVVFVVSHSGGHRLVLVDTDGRLRTVSRPFTLLGGGEERCGGLARIGDQLLISFNAPSRGAMLALVDIDEALYLLE